MVGVLARNLTLRARTYAVNSADLRWLLQRIISRPSSNIRNDSPTAALPRNSRARRSNMQRERLAQYRWYLLDGVQFAAVALTALALMPAGAHVFELSGKLALSPADYVMVQSVHHAWVLFASTMLLASAAIGLHSFLVSRNAASFGWSMVALVLVGAAQIVFWAIAYPVNAATEGWSVLPVDFELLRAEVGVRLRGGRRSELCRVACARALYRARAARSPACPSLNPSSATPPCALPGCARCPPTAAASRLRSRPAGRTAPPSRSSLR